MRIRRSGFTFIEILIVVVILGIVAAVTVPRLSMHSGGYATVAARRLMADLMYAQARAIAQQQNVYVVLDVPQQRYQLLSGPAMTAMEHPIDKQPYVAQFGAGPLTRMQLNAVNAAGHTVIAFDPLGIPFYANGSGVLQDMNDKASITVASGSAVITVDIAAFTGETSISSP